MEKHDVKLLLALALRYLVLALQHLVRLVQKGIVLIRHYSDGVARSPMVLKLNAWVGRFAKRPWFRKCRDVLYRCAAFIVGSSYMDEHITFTARVLVKNDAYRDRLLVAEIEDLVALCDALRLTLPQRKAYFQCFLHVDFMRRSSVSRAELLRYCSLRSTPLTSFLLPNAEEASHRETARNRWDIMQLMVGCFSVCTADIAEDSRGLYCLWTKLIRRAVAESVRPQETEADESDNEESTQGENGKEEMIDQDEGVGMGEHNKVVDGGKLPSTPSICQQIHQCLAFFIGVPDPVERSLLALLEELYGNERFGEQQKNDDLVSPGTGFQDIHGRVLRTRILGVKTWECLQRRRTQLQPHFPIGGTFLSVADIVAASQVQLQQKTNRDYQILTPTSEQHIVDSSLSIALLGGGGGSRSDDSVSSNKSTPRKVVPSTGSELAPSDVKASSYALELPSSLNLTFAQCSSSEGAWRVSANHALASVYIQCLVKENSTASNEALQAEFEQVSKQIFAGELDTEKSEQIRHRLVKVYGYRFAHSLLAKSNVKEQNCASKTPPDERRAKQRYAKAWSGSGLVEDELIYWKEFEDPVAERPFYYNIRTGESRWDMPVTFVGKKKVRRRRKLKSNDAHAHK
ncbi:hypothetical protein PHYPSEUDO_009723 [Phytophthora pseudosyringae]|uniref:WW domain-containing protein n=1 Tax=Phytophthora pseudosyringae TaxID=221518 RepID=A0A8T1VGY5_9STRA|nr:hypothetical protein PHYPSEUDO_009723 [Phytophthora pseudosyringae]